MVGAGVSGLSCAIRLLEKGHNVRIMAKEFSPDLVSDVAAALWYPFLAHPIEKTDLQAIVALNKTDRIGVRRSANHGRNTAQRRTISEA